MRRALEAKESKEHLILMLVKDVMFLRFCGFFLIIIIVFVCGFFVLMGSCFGWYLWEAPSKNDLETREGFHNLFCCLELCFFLQVSQEFISTLFSCFTCFWIWNKEKKSNFWILCFSLFKRFLWFESWKKNGVSYDEWGLQGSLSPGSSGEGLGRVCGRVPSPNGDENLPIKK